MLLNFPLSLHQKQKYNGTQSAAVCFGLMN